MNQPREIIAGVFLEFLKALAAVYLDESPVGINQLLIPVGVINEEAAGHPRSNLFDDRKCLFTEDQRAPLLLLVLPHKPIRPSLLNQ